MRRPCTYVRNRSNVPTGKSSRDDADAKYYFEARMGSGDAGAAGRQAPHPRQPRHRPQLPRREARPAPTSARCTGGKITDMIFAANMLKGQQVKIPTFVVPGSTEVHADMKRLNLRGVEKGANEKSIEDILLDAGCKVGPSGCAACLGGPADTFGRLQQHRSLHQHDQPQFPRPHGQHQVSASISPAR